MAPIFGDSRNHSQSSAWIPLARAVHFITSLDVYPLNDEFSGAEEIGSEPGLFGWKVEHQRIFETMPVSQKSSVNEMIVLSGTVDISIL